MEKSRFEKQNEVILKIMRKRPEDGTDNIKTQHKMLFGLYKYNYNQMLTK